MKSGKGWFVVLLHCLSPMWGQMCIWGVWTSELITTLGLFLAAGPEDSMPREGKGAELFQLSVSFALVFLEVSRALLCGAVQQERPLSLSFELQLWGNTMGSLTFCQQRLHGTSFHSHHDLFWIVRWYTEGLLKVFFSLCFCFEGLCHTTARFCLQLNQILITLQCQSLFLVIFLKC